MCFRGLKSRREVKLKICRRHRPFKWKRIDFSWPKIDTEKIRSKDRRSTSGMKAQSVFPRKGKITIRGLRKSQQARDTLWMSRELLLLIVDSFSPPTIRHAICISFTHRNGWINLFDSEKLLIPFHFRVVNLTKRWHGFKCSHYT
jgi:hypothetical protein